jgi:catechol 2,3-dioxygenase
MLCPMTTNATQTAASAPGAALGDGTRLGAAHLTVTNLDRSIAFYQDAIGMRVHRRDDTTAALGAGEEDVLVLVEEPRARPAGRHAGLYHVALLYPSRLELARAGRRLALTRTPIEGASDHGTHEAIYLPDPDGNGLELAADRPREQWPDPRDTNTFAGGPQPLDIHGLLGLVTEAEPVRHAEPGLRVGHIHLHVADLDEGIGFYRDVLGFELMTTFARAVFVAAGGYHHHIGFNLWRGAGVPPAPADAVGLRHWTLLLESDAEMAALRERARAGGIEVLEREDGVLLRDPSGIAVVAAVAPTAPAGELRSRAEVETAKPSPYLLQLAKHFRHKLDVEFDDRSATIPFAFGRCELRAQDGRLVLEASAPSAAELARVQDVIGSHLERFGRNDELSVAWVAEG